MLFNTFGDTYYIDLDKLEKEIEMEKSSDETSGETQFHLVKYEMIKMMIETILTESDSVDEKLGPNNSELTIPFKISFNTLRVKNIINKL
jgi:hypothetical protein